MTAPDRNGGTSEHGDVFGRGWGNMLIHVQRESGLAHRTLVLRPWQVQALRLVVSKWFALIGTGIVLSWLYFAVQTTRLPFLVRRIAHLEQDAAKLDTLQVTLDQLQRRYDQVQQMLSAAGRVPQQPSTDSKPAEAKADARPAAAAGTTPADGGAKSSATEKRAAKKEPPPSNLS